jgi:hypothetical protein
MELTHTERTFYRKLFLRRYALLLQKVEQTYSITPESLQRLRSAVLSVDWAESRIDALLKRLTRIEDEDVDEDGNR